MCHQEIRKMNPNKIAHLGFIQSVITRLSTNSFLIKAWSVTVVAATFALAAKDANINYILVAYLPVVIFWGLDGFFLAQERQYRELYRVVAERSEAEIDFSMDASNFDSGNRTIWFCIFSKTLLPFHGVLLAVILVVMFVIPRLRAAG